jgi:hypothetical protein
MSINELKLSAIVKTISEVVKLRETGDDAINLTLDFNFGQKKCTCYATAYKQVATEASKLQPGDKLVLNGAFYIDNYKDKKTGQYQNTPKVRINSFEYEDQKTNAF